MKLITKYIVGLLFFTGLFSCTDLTETVYDQIVTENYYNTRQNVISAVFRPFEGSFWSIGNRFTINEQTADQLGTWSRNGWWLDGQVWQRLHYHTWTIDDTAYLDEWNWCFIIIMQTNSVLDDLKTLEPSRFGMEQKEFDFFSSQIRTLRAWLYIRLLDAFRNIPLAVSKDVSQNPVGQVPPNEIFNFIETELKDVLVHLPAKEGANGNGVNQGLWNKAGVASLLVRLYLNAEKWIGTAKYNECAEYAQKIINGEYGNYKLGATWDEVFDWQNELSNEVIFGFPSTYGRSPWHYSSNMYWWCLPSNAHFYLGTQQQGIFNPKYGLQPSYDVQGNLYTFTEGKPVYKFNKYPTDYRLKLYRNLGNSKREGMFLYGYLEYEENGKTKKVMSPVGDYELYIRDQVGVFNNTPPGEIPQNTTSDMENADHNSGWHFIKYPLYGDNESGKQEADFVEVRLAEIYYSLAECKFRLGDISTAANLLNKVRKRNYPVENHKEYLYQPEGNVELTADELLDEWGREFLGEGRRRTDLIRWGKFTKGTWWDKQPDSDDHLEIFPLHRSTLSSDPSLKQNPGYEEIR